MTLMKQRVKLSTIAKTWRHTCIGSCERLESNHINEILKNKLQLRPEETELRRKFDHAGTYVPIQSSKIKNIKSHTKEGEDCG